MATINELIVKLKAQSSEWTAGVKKAKADLDDLNKHAADSATARGKTEEKAGGSFFAKARLANLEARQSGEVAFERLLKGGGAFALGTFAAEGINKASEAASTALQKVREGEISATQGWNEFTQSALSSIPVFGTFFKAAESFTDAAAEVSAAIVKARGGSEDEQDAQLKDHQLLEKYERQVERQKVATETLTHARSELNKELAKGFDKERQDEAERYRKSLEDISSKIAKISHGRPDSGLGTADLNSIKTLRLAQQDIQRQHGAVLERIDREEHEKRENEAKQFEIELAGIEARGNQRRLQILGSSYAAELFSLKTAYAKEEQEAVLHAREMERNRPRAEVDEIEKRKNEKLEALWKARGQLEITAAMKAADDLGRESAEAQTRINELNVSAAAIRLRSLGQEGTARILEIKAQAEQELAERKRAVAELVKQHREGGTPFDKEAERQELENFAAYQIALARDTQAKIDAAKKDERNAALDRQTEIDQINARARIGLLKAQGEAGDALKRQEAEKLELAQRYNDEIASLNRMLRERNDLNDQQRQDIKSDIATITKEKEAALKALSQKGEGPHAPVERMFTFSLPDAPKNRDDKQNKGDESLVKIAEFLTSGDFGTKFLQIWQALTGQTKATSSNGDTIVEF